MMQSTDFSGSAEHARLWASELHLAEARAARLTRPTLAPLATDAIAGAAAGVATGVWCGPLGAVIGAFVGGVMGLGTGIALGTSERAREAHERYLEDQPD